MRVQSHYSRFFPGVRSLFPIFSLRDFSLFPVKITIFTGSKSEKKKQQQQQQQQISSAFFSQFSPYISHFPPSFSNCSHFFLVFILLFPFFSFSSTFPISYLFPCLIFPGQSPKFSRWKVSGGTLSPCPTACYATGCTGHLTTFLC